MGRGGEDRDGRLIDLRVSVGRACEEWGRWTGNCASLVGAIETGKRIPTMCFIVEQ